MLSTSGFTAGNGTHTDIYKPLATYAGVLARNLKWAQAVKAVGPTALITGPVPAGWSGMLFSRADMNSGWGKSPWQYWDNPVEYHQYGETYWVPYYLQQMQQCEQQLDVHAYIAPAGLSGSRGDAAMETLRMTSTGALWDPNYYPPGGGFEDATGAEVAPQMVPRMRQWVADNYPGAQTAITEYNWGARTRLRARSPKPTSSAFSAVSNSTTRRCGSVCRRPVPSPSLLRPI